MKQIDLEKFIYSLIEHSKGAIPYINNALKDQGLEYKDGQIVEIPKPLEIKAGQWYVCIKDYGFCEHDYLTFEKGKVYKSEKDEELTASDGGKWPFGDAKDYFRPATEDEIPHEPKFKVDDLTASDTNLIRRIIKVENGFYTTDYGILPIEDYDSVFHLWSIYDAKCGDIITMSYNLKNYIIIFKNLYEKSFKHMMSVYCFYCKEEDTYYDETDSFHIMNQGETITPATKEQCQFLFEKMKEAGYQFDVEKKELKRIQKIDLDNTNGTNTIKFEEPEEELTEFEEKVKDLIGLRSPLFMQQVKEETEILLALARKQIADGIDIESMTEVYRKTKDIDPGFKFPSTGMVRAYRQGILDTLEKIKRKQ